MINRILPATVNVQTWIVTLFDIYIEYISLFLFDTPFQKKEIFK